MLAKKYKLPIQEFLKKKVLSGKRLDFFHVKTLENNLPHSRFGIVISKKVSGKSSDRNKIKRMIFSLIAKNKKHLLSGKDILIIVQPNAKFLSKEEAEKVLGSFL